MSILFKSNAIVWHDSLALMASSTFLNLMKANAGSF
jgi:hypothetical protein